MGLPVIILPAISLPVINLSGANLVYHLVMHIEDLSTSDNNNMLSGRPPVVDVSMDLKNISVCSRLASYKLSLLCGRKLIVL